MNPEENKENIALVDADDVESAYDQDVPPVTK